MNSLIKRVLFGSILLSLGACAHYQRQAYYPATGAYTGYSSGYNVAPGSYYGGYPYRYNNSYPDNNYSYPVYGNYRHDHDDDDHSRYDNYNYHNDGYNVSPSWNHGRLKADPSNVYDHHPERKHKQWITKEPDPRHSDRPHQKDDDIWRRPTSDHPSGGNNHQHGRPDSAPENYGQHHRHDDGRDNNRRTRQHEWAANKPIKDQGRYGEEPEHRFRKENHDPIKYQRKNHREDHQ